MKFGITDQRKIYEILKVIQITLWILYRTEVS